MVSGRGWGRIGEVDRADTGAVITRRGPGMSGLPRANRGKSMAQQLCYRLWLTLQSNGARVIYLRTSIMIKA